MNNLKNSIAKSIQSAFTGSAPYNSGMQNMEFSGAMSGKVASALKNVTVDGNLAIDDEQKYIFQKMLETLQKIAESDRNTVKERKQVRDYLAQLVATNEIEADKLKVEIDKQKAQLDKIQNDKTLDKDKADKEIEKLTKEIEKLEKDKAIREKTATEARGMDIGTQRGGDMSAQQYFRAKLKRDINSDLNLMFPGVRWKQEEGESFGGMVKRTGKGILSRGATGIADAMFGRAAPEDSSLQSVVDKKKQSIGIGEQIQQMYAKPKTPTSAPMSVADEQLDLFAGKTLTPRPVIAPPKNDPDQGWLFNQPPMPTNPPLVGLPTDASAAYFWAKQAGSAKNVTGERASINVSTASQTPATPQIAPSSTGFSGLPSGAEASDFWAKQAGVLPSEPQTTEPAPPAKAKRSRKKKVADVQGTTVEVTVQTPKEIEDLSKKQVEVTDKIGEVLEEMKTLVEKISDNETDAATVEAKSPDIPDLFGGDTSPEILRKRRGSRGPRGPRTAGKGETLSGGEETIERAKKRGSPKMPKTAANTAKKSTTKAATKAVGKTVGKGVLKKLPVIGAAVGLGLGLQRMMSGDMLGGVGEIASGAASTIPGFGTAASFAIDAGLAVRDTNIADALESGSEREIMPAEPVPASPSMAVAAPPPSRAERTTVSAAPTAPIRSSENSFVRFQDKRVARV